MAESPQTTASPPKTPPHRILEDPVTQHTPPESASRPARTSDTDSGQGRNDGEAWRAPTSGQLAYLASLPKPTIRSLREDEEVTAATREDDSTEPEVMQKQEAEAETTGESRTSLNDVLLAISRQRNAMHDGREIRRQDTWALGERWQRRIRVIDDGQVARRKNSVEDDDLVLGA